MPQSGLPEWVEIYNSSDSTVLISGWKLGDAISMKTLPSFSLEAGAFAVLCQNPSTFADTLCEGAQLIQPSGWSVLNNDADAVRLLDEVDSVRDAVSYTVSQFGGCMNYNISAEVTAIGGAELACCPVGATASCANASWPQFFDLRIDSIRVNENPTTSQIAIIDVFISNIGIETVSGSYARLFRSPTNPSPIDSVAVGALEAGESVVRQISAQLEDGRYELTIRLSDDDNLLNNSAIAIVLVGKSGWPLCITEFLFMPVSGSPEWIEIFNSSTAPIDLSGWRFGDEISIKSIPPCTLAALSFALLCQDTAAFSDSLCEGSILLQPSSWPILNNDQDMIRLFDADGLLRQCVSYNASNLGGCSAAGVSVEAVSAGSSEFICGFWSPGCPNEIWSRPAGERTIEISPNPFDPALGPSTISVSLPAGGLEVKVYDRSGFVRRSLSSATSPSGFSLIWDGADDRGKPLPAGIYIVFAKDSEANSVKKAVAIIGGKR